MAGRGTDIKLGGNKDYIENGETNNLEDFKKSEKEVKKKEVYLSLEPKDMKVEELIIN